MIIHNEENKTPGIRGNQKDSRYEPYPDRHSGSGYVSGVNGVQSFGVCREDREGQDTIGNPGRENSGEVIGDLIEEVQEQLSESENRTEKLKKTFSRLVTLRNLLNANKDIE
ncbi:hypothetical protein CAL7716_072410 [Calothrix sp. PCC 7716]|nr:hypothetical protein CAL7716_072410 [Calothrix sp. PCC 7716]